MDFKMARAVIDCLHDWTAKLVKVRTTLSYNATDSSDYCIWCMTTGRFPRGPTKFASGGLASRQNVLSHF